MNDINNIPINWDDGSESKLLGSLFPKTGNSFGNITNSKKFEQNSPFKNSPFGQYWDKNIHEWAKDIYGDAKILDKNKVTIADLSSKISHTQAETLNSLASKNTSKYSFVVYANPDGEQVIKMYEDPKVVPKLPFEILVFIETDDGKFDFGKIVRVKFGPEVIDDLKDKYFKELPWKDNDPKDIAKEFIKRAWSANVSSQTKQDVNQERNNSDFKDLLIKAIQYEYDNHKFDDFSWFIVFLKGAEFVGLNLPQWSFQIGNWLRTKKYKEAKYWNGDLPEKEYTPAFLPNSIFYDKADDRIKSLKEYTNLPYEQIRKEINEKISGKDILSKKLKNWLIQNIDECEKTTDEFLKKLAKIYIPDGNFQTILKHYHAFEVGLFNGILEFLAGLCDLLAIIILISRNELGFRISDKLNEKFENFAIDLFYNTFELLRKIGEKLFEILVDFGKWYDTYQGKSYFIFKELGELVPDILATIIPILKGSKVAKAGTVTVKEVTEEAIEEAVEKNIKELTEEEAKLISKTAKEALERDEIKEATEKALKEAEEKIEGKIKNQENLDDVKLKNKKTSKEKKVFLKKVDLNILLKQYADEALTKWKDAFSRPGAVGILEGEINGKIYQVISYSSKGISKSKIIGRRHKLVQEWLEEIAEQSIRNRRNHGKCAEPVCISEFLFEAEKQLGLKANSMKIEQAREILSKTKSKALRIDNIKEPLVQGLPKKACATCNPMLHYFKIKEIH